MSDTTLRRGAAAWQWFRFYRQQNLSESGVRLAFGRFAQLVPAMTVMRHDDGFVGYCLGTERWAALFWPLTQINSGSELNFALDYAGTVSWQFFHDLDSWTVLESHVEWEGHLIWLTVDSSEPLLKHFLREPASFKGLSQSDLMLVAEALLIAPTYGDRSLIGKMPWVDLVMSLVRHVGDDDYVASVEAKMKQPELRSKSKISSDDVQFGGPLDQLIYLELGGDERRDFKEVGDAVFSKQKANWGISSKQLVERLSKAAGKKATSKKTRRGAFLNPTSKKNKKTRRGAFLKKRKAAAMDPDPGLEPPLDADDAASLPPADPAPLPGTPPPSSPAAEARTPHRLRLSPGPRPRHGQELEPCPGLPRHVIEERLVPAPLEPVRRLSPHPDGAGGGPSLELEGGDAAAPVRPGPGAGLRRGQEQLQPSLFWTTVSCRQCGAEIGQFKLAPQPGSRDPPTWFMRCKNGNGAWAQNGPNFSRRQVSKVGESEDYVRQWIADRHSCGGV